MSKITGLISKEISIVKSQIGHCRSMIVKLQNLETYPEDVLLLIYKVKLKMFEGYLLFLLKHMGD